MVAVRKTNVVRAAEPGFEMVCAHGARELVEAPVVVGAIGRLNMKVGHWWVVGGVLTVHLGAIPKLGLECLPQNRIERLELARTDVETTHLESYDVLKSFKVISHHRCLFQVLWSERPEIDDPLNGGAWLENFDW